MKLEPPRLRLLGRGAGLVIYLVNGERVRNEIDVDFVNGGNEAVYPNFIPRDEIWIDDAQHALDRTATTLHELIERDLMLHHGMDYDTAHDRANVYERAFRRRLQLHRPSAYDARRVMKAYRSYLSGRRNQKTRRELDQDIIGTLNGRSRAAP